MTEPEKVRLLVAPNLLTDHRVLALSKLLDLPLAEALGSVVAIRLGLVANGLELTATIDAVLEAFARWKGTPGALARSYRAVFAPLGVDADIATATVGKTGKAKVSTPKAAPLHPHFSQEDCAALFYAWRKEFSPTSYPRFRAAFAPLFEGGDLTVAAVLWMLNTAGAVYRHHAAYKLRGYGPESFVKEIGFWKDVYAAPEDMRLDKAIHGITGRRPT